MLVPEDGHGTDTDTFQPRLEEAIHFYRTDFREHIKTTIENALLTGKQWDFEAVIITTENQEKWVRAIGTPEFVNGKCVRLYGSFQDIHNLKSTEKRLSDISDNLPGVVYQYIVYPNGDDAITYVSGAVEEIWGFTAEETMQDINLIWNQIQKGGDFEIAIESLNKAIETKSKWYGRFRYMKPTGEVCMHIGHGIPSFFADGTIIFNSIIMDVTKENKNEALLKQASEVAQIGSWEMDLTNPNQNQMDWSTMIFDILELEESYEANYNNFLGFFDKEGKIRIRKSIDLLIKDGLEFDEELLVKTRNGEKKWVRCMGDREIANNTPVKIFGSFQDIHESKTIELRLSDILNSISDAFYAVDKKWNFTYFNKEAESLLNRKTEDVLHHNIWRVFPKAKNSPLKDIYHEVTSTQVSKTFEYFYPGDHSWYEVSAYPSLEGLSVYFKSIDDRKRAEQELVKAFEEKNNILESIGDGFFSVKKNWTVTYWNREAELLTGIKKDEIIGHSFWDIYSRDAANSFYLNYKKAMDEEVKVTFEEYYPAINKWFETNAYPSDEGLSVYFKDTTQRKLSEIQLNEANDRFVKVTEATKDAIWDWDIEKNTFFRSDAIKHFFGGEIPLSLSEENFWQDNFHPDDLDEIQNKIKEFKNDPNCFRWELEYRIINNDNETVYVIDRGIITRNDDGKATRMVGSMTDITEQKTMTLKLNQLNKELKIYASELERSNFELEQFAFITSHDLQEPLRMISSFMDLLKRKYETKLDDKALQYIDFATDGARRMKQIILDLLEYSRAGRPAESKTYVDLNEVLVEYKILRRKIISEKAAVLSYKKLPKIYSNKVIITQIFHSLLDNAIKYSKKDIAPYIEVEVIEKKLEWQFSVKDNGIGIDQKFYDKIFVIFQRLHNRDEFAGTGIGLSIAKKHTESLGGNVWLESKLGKGTTMYFTIKKVTPPKNETKT